MALKELRTSSFASMFLLSRYISDMTREEIFPKMEAARDT